MFSCDSMWFPQCVGCVCSSVPRLGMASRRRRREYLGVALDLQRNRTTLLGILGQGPLFFRIFRNSSSLLLSWPYHLPGLVVPSFENVWHGWSLSDCMIFYKLMRHYDPYKIIPKMKSWNENIWRTKQTGVLNFLTCHLIYWLYLASSKVLVPWCPMLDWRLFWVRNILKRFGHCQDGWASAIPETLQGDVMIYAKVHLKSQPKDPKVQKYVGKCHHFVPKKVEMKI